jgi:hypothetical protein
MTTSIAFAQRPANTITGQHRPWCRRHPKTNVQCSTSLKVRGTSMLLILVQQPDGTDPYISFDAHNDTLSTGRLSLTEAGNLAAALSDLRAKAAEG